MGGYVVRDLGVLEGDLWVMGGVCSNLHALRAFIDLAGDSEVLCTGDLVAYCGDPAGVVAEVRARGWPVVAGNCERQIADGALDCGCGFGEGTTCDLLSRGWYAHALTEIGPEQRGWMAGLPDIVTFSVHGQRWAAIHGGVTAINRFLWPTSNDVEFLHEIRNLQDIVGPLHGVVSGHSGLAFARDVGGVHWVNAGALGVPPHDGGQATRYVVLGEAGPQIQMLEYDVVGAAAAMRSAGLVQGYERTLETGWWPSEDILPQELRRIQPSRASG